MNNGQTMIEMAECMRHAIGIDSRNKKPTRNHYCGENPGLELELELAVQLGFCVKHAPVSFVPDPTYCVTELGFKFLGVKFPGKGE